MLSRPHQPVLPPPPPIDCASHSLFVDFDGTLVPLVDHPELVRADSELVELLDALHTRYGGRLALVSGRSLAQLDAMIGPVVSRIALAGSHGAEVRRGDRLVEPPRPEGLDGAIADVRAYGAGHPEMIVEEKSHGVAMHYRRAPILEEPVKRRAYAIAERHGLEVQLGKMMVELRGPGWDKGQAVAVLMGEPPMAASLPVVIGDDLTDEPALKVAGEMGGFGVLVGAPRESAALYGLTDVGSVRHWLWEAAR
ncbi:trehalose-phosphatase [Rhizorhabdus dicambivorans]|uniref:Trehalose 6-phosphate phosphatase n=1 Tax=Rhizorhabdus dicambivorans TaxID=1850238 RepID=A0A2A4FPU6_9SPHN|nr:trehalose-phosphatase [Rhizorhabdus dicambivorans]ATE63997.1 trehalose-phosphatase [Rhizorhabdus dicambivorans]PCE40197.1 trehalose-phosphatase [Rhizorhabdus dicambivorans]